jgi:hypothetical protein
LTRFAGVLAPHAPWRAEVVAYGRRGAASAASGTTPERTRNKRKKKREASATSEPPRRARTALGGGIAQPIGACGARIPSADLLRRIYPEEVIACPCGGRRRVLATLDTPDAIEALLYHLSVPMQAPPAARARSPSLDAA